jgi:phosphotransferase system enzyme I (PtsI)
MGSEEIYKGISASTGISIGYAYLFTRSEVKISTQMLSDEETAKELLDFEEALEHSKKELKKILSLSKQKIGDEDSKIFDAQLEILDDRYFIENVIKRIISEKRSASYIFDEEISKIAGMLISSTDEFLSERYSDVNDIKNRVVRNMRREKLISKVDENSIIVAHELTPADTILFSRRKVKGYIADTGGVTSHAALIARALRVPAIVGMKTISKHIHTGDFIIADGLNGLVIKDPTKETILRYESKIAELKEYEKKLIEVIDLPTETTDKREIEVSANIEFDEEIDFVTSYGHCDIGLYRTEHLFIEKGDFPSEEEQYNEYLHISNVTFPKCVTIRTYDIGGDKLLPGSLKENNPYLGWRGIRICLDRPEIFEEQLRAILRASGKRNIRIMFPMITSLDELLKSKEILEKVKKELDCKNINYDKSIEIGIMVETPAAYLIADELAREVNFFSIGTNDLIQYLIAVDRGNDMISYLYQKFHPAVIRVIKGITEAGKRNGIHVTVCGDMASEPVAAPLLIGMGIDEMSVVPQMFPEIKQIIRSLNYKETQELADRCLKMSREEEIRETLEEFLKVKVHRTNLIETN